MPQAGFSPYFRNYGEMSDQSESPRQDRQKVFCIGRNKTGTTSLGRALENIGFRLGKQAIGEALLKDWSQDRFDRIIDFCRSADAFQDVPFSLPKTYEALDAAYTDARFILTIRDSADAWFQSLVRFHSHRLGGGRKPTAALLKQHPYRYRGYMWDVHRWAYGADETTLYEPDLYKHGYDAHNAAVESYFAGRPDKLLIVNLGDDDAETRIADFVDYKGGNGFLPHLNRTR